MTDATSPTRERLEDQISWYNKKSQSAQSWYKGLKVVQLVTAGLIPFLATLGIPRPESVTAFLGLVILIVEGLQQLNQYQTNWISYRSTCEALQHEKYLFLAGAGPYLNLKDEDRLALLADRIEGLISREHAKWLSAQQQPGKRDETGAKPPS